jgi:hypothetical protein
MMPELPNRDPTNAESLPRVGGPENRPAFSCNWPFQSLP